MKIGILGSKRGIPAATVFTVLDKMKSKHKIEMIISGGGGGTDTFADQWASRHSIKMLIIFPQWRNQKTDTVQEIRNQKIVDEADEIVMFWDGKAEGRKEVMGMCKKDRKPFHLIFRDDLPFDNLTEL